MTSDKVEIYSTNKLYEAEMIREYLTDHNIQSYILNKMDSTYLFGDVEILVSKDDVIMSKKLIEDFFSNE